MQKDLQLAIWQFILAYKQRTGEQVNYIELASHSAYREEMLGKAEQGDDEQLQQLAKAVRRKIELEKTGKTPLHEDIESESLLLSEAPAEVWVAQADTSHANTTIGNTNNLNDDHQPPGVRYAQRLRGALKRSEFTLLHRRALDRFAKKHNMSVAETLRVENTLRSKLKLPPLAWDKELSSVIRDLRKNHSSLTTLRKHLRQTYVRKDRLDESMFQHLFNGPSGMQDDFDAHQEPEKAPGNAKRWAWIAGAGSLVLIGLALIFTV